MKGSRIAPWISIFAGLLWFFAAFKTNERVMLSVSVGTVFLVLGLIQLKVNSARFKDEEPATPDEDAQSKL